MKEALKLALEALEYWDVHGVLHQPTEEAITAIKAALAHLEQEPVAIKRMKEWIEYLKRKSDFGQHMKIPCEISAGTCWELAIELEQFINTTPPQRPWVDLEPEDRLCAKYILDSPLGIEEVIDFIEAKLRDKNT